MDIVFGNKKLGKICETEGAMVRRYGRATARKLMLRLTELQAADTLEYLRTLPAARCHELSADRAGSLAVDLDHPRRLVFRPNHDPVPVRADGGLDWNAVTSIIVEEIVDYH